MSDCIFCKIANGDITSNKIFEDDNFIVILDAFPVNKGHCLVVPKKHFENIFEIDFETLKKAHELAKKTALKIRDVLNIKNINILQNNGEIAGQSVFHFHIHVMPREDNDTVVIKGEPIKILDSDIKNLKQMLRL